MRAKFCFQMWTQFTMEFNLSLCKGSNEKKRNMILPLESIHRQSQKYFSEKVITCGVFYQRPKPFSTTFYTSSIQKKQCVIHLDARGLKSRRNTRKMLKGEKIFNYNHFYVLFLLQYYLVLQAKLFINYYD